MILIPPTGGNSAADPSMSARSISATGSLLQGD